MEKIAPIRAPAAALKNEKYEQMLSFLFKITDEMAPIK